MDKTQKEHEMAIDQVCGMMVDEHLAVRAAAGVVVGT